MNGNNKWRKLAAWWEDGQEYIVFNRRYPWYTPLNDELAALPEEIRVAIGRGELTLLREVSLATRKIVLATHALASSDGLVVLEQPIRSNDSWLLVVADH